MQLVDQPGFEILPYGRNATAQSRILTAGGLRGLVERVADAAGNEAKFGTALHGERRAWVVGEHEYWIVIGRLFSPPATPHVVWPRATDRSEHVAAEYPGADAGEA